MTWPAVLGVDGCRGGWVGVRLGGPVPTAYVAPTIGELVAGGRPGLECVGIDMPIGLPDDGPPSGRGLVRVLLGRRRSTVFSTLVREAYAAPSYAEGQLVQRRGHRHGLQPAVVGTAPQDPRGRRLGAGPSPRARRRGAPRDVLRGAAGRAGAPRARRPPRASGRGVRRCGTPASSHRSDRAAVSGRTTCSTRASSRGRRPGWRAVRRGRTRRCPRRSPTGGRPPSGRDARGPGAVRTRRRGAPAPRPRGRRPGSRRGARSGGPPRRGCRTRRAGPGSRPPGCHRPAGT